MSRVFIGTYGGSQEQSEAVWETELAISYIRWVCGKPPAGAELEVGWGETDCGEYPVIELVWEDPIEDDDYYPEEYIDKCIEALESFDSD
jgi:hypothetical protein